MLNLEKLDKGSLRKEFAKEPDKYYKVKLFDELGFKRHTCRICGMNFWSIKNRDVCDDPSHTEYSFFKDKPKPFSYVKFWKLFAEFFKKNGHEVIDRYPVVSRWRQDLYFTIASIQDFQRIENGAMSFEYSANPLVVPQICLRFNDMENAGITGRHFSSFMMAGQHAFNYPKEGYWRDRTIELNYKFLTTVLGVKKEDLVYNEDVWAMGDFSEFGPCLEFFSGGAELGNNVFTQFEYVNGKVRELDNKIVDVGWGFERLLWFYTGFDTAFEAVFYDVLKALEKKISFKPDSRLFKKFSTVSSELDVTEKGSKTKTLELLKKAGIPVEDYEKKIKPQQALYAVLDHTRTLLFAITDGALPSNIGGGYNLRVILRRALSFIDEYNFNFTLNEVAELEAEDLKELFPELSENLKLFAKIVEIEKRRFETTRGNAERIITTLLSKNKKIDAKELRTLYESNGITPELIETAAAKKNIKLSMPESSYEDIMKGDFVTKEKGKKLDIDVSGIDKTEQLYYKLAEESNSKILKTEKNYVVLDKSPFYPEGGGQEADHGTINGHDVKDVQKISDVIVHVMADDVDAKKGMKKGDTAKCAVDKERRRRLMVHHTSTHLMSAAARSILGKHAWQEGTRKQFDKAHIDIAHYDRLSEGESTSIEDFVNDKLLNGIKVSVNIMDRDDAEGKYGFEIYQGHGVPSSKIRIVLIEDKNGKFIDAEACGGLHVTGMEQAIGTIKIINTERISDGVDRIEFVAGKAALDYFRKETKELDKVSQMLNVERLGVHERLIKLNEDYKNVTKLNQELNANIANAVADSIEISEHLKGKKDAELELDYPREMLRKIVTELVQRNKESTILARNKNNDIVCIAGPASKESAVEFARKKLGSKFKGGGSDKFAEGKI